MKAYRLHAFGGPESLKCDELPSPDPGPGQVRLRLRGIAQLPGSDDLEGHL